METKTETKVKMRTKLVLVAGAVLLTLVLGPVGTVVAQAGTPPSSPWEGGEGPLARRGARVYGVVKAVEGNSLALATPIGPVTILTDSNTRFRIPGVEEPSLSDLDAGETVGAGGWWEEDGSTFHAFGVVQLEADGALPLAGSLSDVGDDTLTIETGRRPATVRVNDETVYRVRGVEEAGLDDLSVDDASIADLQVGDRIAGEGVIEENGAGSGQPGGRATLVIVLPEQVARLSGQVAAVEGTTLELDTPGGTVNVLTGAETVLRVPGVERPTVDDVQVGDQVTAAGTWEDETTFDAIAVGVRGGRRAGQRATVRGRVIRVETDQLVLGTPHGPVTVLVDGETQYRAPDVDDANLDDVTPGVAVGARGTWNEDGTLRATGVAVSVGL